MSLISLKQLSAALILYVIHSKCLGKVKFHTYVWKNLLHYIITDLSWRPLWAISPYYSYQWLLFRVSVNCFTLQNYWSYTNTDGNMTRSFSLWSCGVFLLFVGLYANMCVRSVNFSISIGFERSPLKRSHIKLLSFCCVIIVTLVDVSRREQLQLNSFR